MARGLLGSEPEFRASIDRCEKAMAPFVEWSLLEQLTLGGERLDEIDVIQPVLFAIQVALADLWRSRGVLPDAVVGHSMGEVAAAHVAGILTLDDAVRVICRRSRLMRRISGLGAMAVVGLDIDRARQAIAGREDRISVAVSNSHTSTVLSGEPEALAEVMAQLSADDIFCRRVNVDVASHSPQVDGLQDELIAAVAEVRPRPAWISFVSTVTGRFEDGRGLDARYWARNLREPVLFTDATRQLLDTDHVRFVELSPHPVLLTSVQEMLDTTGRTGVTVASMQRDTDEPSTMWSALGALYASGHTVDWRALHPNPSPAVDLPPYPWQRERHWLDMRRHAGSGRTNRREDSLLGWSVPIAQGGVVEVWENELERRHDPSLFDQCIEGVAVVPAAAHLALMLGTAAKFDRIGLADVRFDAPAPVGDDEVLPTQVVADPSRGTLAVYAGPGGSRSWGATSVLGAVAAVHAARAFANGWLPRPLTDRDVSADVYRRLCQLGLDIGPPLQSITGFRLEEGRLIAEIARPADTIGANGFEIALLDACFQSAVLAASEHGSPGLHLPVAAGAVTRWAPPTDHMTCCVSPVSSTDTSSAPASCYDVVLYDDAGRPVVTIDHLVLEIVTAVTAQAEDIVYSIEWRVVDDRRMARAAAGRCVARLRGSARSWRGTGRRAPHPWGPMHHRGARR